jgi:predicted AAA+ superfamily ATPase
MGLDPVELKAVIQEQEAERRAFLGGGGIVEREAAGGEAKRALAAPNILAVTGPRRCGKSVLTWLLARSLKSGCINFDDERLGGARTGDLNTVLRVLYEVQGSGLECIVLDEIQNVAGWELFASRLRGTRKVIVTGSNSRFLSGELATHLTGRHIDLVLFPYSFREYIKSESSPGLDPGDYTSAMAARAQALMSGYLAEGGFPEVKKLGTGMLKQLFSDIVTNDVVRRHTIRVPSDIYGLARHLLTSTAKEVSFSRLRPVIGGRKLDTVKRYVGYLSDAYLIFLLERFSYKLREQILAPKKVYCIDQGLARAVSFRTGEDEGRMMETAVAVELRRRACAIGSDLEVYYWKDHQQHEVDFVLKAGTDVEQLIQVCVDATEPDVRKRELRAILKASGELRCKKLLILTRDHEEDLKLEGQKVRFLPLWKWLVKDPAAAK